MLQLITTKPGDKYRSIRNPRMYRALRRQGHSKESAARITNARHKTYTLDQLEAFVTSPAYDADTAQAIAARVPSLPRLKGEQIAPGVTRIRGNLCNVHGRYGRCPGAGAAPTPAKPTAAKPKKGRAARKPRQTPEQRAQARAQQQQANIDNVAKRMAETDTGLSPSGSNALVAFASGQQPDALHGDGLVQMGLAERASDGSYRMTPTGRAAVNAMRAGDYQRAVDAVSRGGDAQRGREGRAQERTQRQQDAAGKRAARQMDRELARRQRDAKRQTQQARPKPAKSGGSGGDKKPTEPGPEKPRRLAPRKRIGRSQAPSVGGLSDKPKPKPAAPAKQETTPALAETARQLSSGAALTEGDTQALIRNGLARLNKDGELILTAAGQRAVRQKAASFMVFKDARGQYRWVAQSSTAYQDRDQEIVSTKALADDVQRADVDGHYGPLRWWHSPGLDLGACDFNAMHGRVLIESGTFYSEAIAQKVARAVAGLEISLGFLHPPTEPDASGVFHHIRRFERSLVPRGKASNRFTAFAVKESRLMDEKKIAALKTLGFSDSDIADIEARASATEKAADDQQTAYKAEEPQQEITIGGVTYLLTEKAHPVTEPVEETTKDEGEGDIEVIAETDAIEPVAEEPYDDTAVTLSSGDIEAISQAIGAAVSQALAPLAGLLDMEKKMQGHVQSLMAPYQAQKDASDAERAEEIATLKATLAETQAKLTELIGDQPAAGYRPSQAVDNILGADATLLEAVKSQQPGSGPFDDIVQNLFGNGLAPSR